MKKTVLGLGICSSVVFGITNEELLNEMKLLKQELQEIKSTQSSIVDEMAKEEYLNGEEYESFSSMGGAASKVYYSKDALSLGGYGEYKATKYTNYKNYNTTMANNTRNKLETNIVRFVPYIGFKFNDWIIMNTEIEFEDGGARSDGEKNYKYAIVEFSYLDFLIDKSFAIRAGHILVPMGLINLNHEPVSYLSTDRPTVESYIIPSTWHTNGILTHGKIDNLEYYAGMIISPDAGGFTEGRFIQQGRTGAKVFSDDFSFVGRLSYDLFDGLNIGASFLYGNSSATKESKPGTSTGINSNARVTITIAELHATYKKENWNIQTIATYGALGGDVAQLSNSVSQEISKSVHGEYLNIGYDILPWFFKSSQNLYTFVEIEHLNMDASSDTTYTDNNHFMEYSAGLSYFIDPKVVLKADYKIKDYASQAKLADENSFAFALGFIF